MYLATGLTAELIRRKNNISPAEHESVDNENDNVDVFRK